MRFSRHSALSLFAAALAMPPLVASSSVAAEPTGGSDDHYVNACNAAGQDFACGVAHSKVVPNEIPPTTRPTADKSVQDQTARAYPNSSGPAPTTPAQAAGDDLFQHLATPLGAPAAASESVPVKLAQSIEVDPALEVVPAPESIAPLESPQRLPPAPAASGLNRPIATLTLDAAADPELVANLSKLKTDVAIKDVSIARFGSWGEPRGDASAASSHFSPQVFSWAAPALYTNPIYFEQPNVERYGHYVAVCKRDNLTQSAISAAHFFVSVPALPYMVGAKGPCECNYVLGSYRPGSCNPHQLVKPPLSLRGLVYEGVAATGLVFLLP